MTGESSQVRKLKMLKVLTKYFHLRLLYCCESNWEILTKTLLKASLLVSSMTKIYFAGRFEVLFTRLNEKIINDVFQVLIIGPPDTLYEGGFFKCHLLFPREYPLRPPVLK